MISRGYIRLFICWHSHELQFWFLLAVIEKHVRDLHLLQWVLHHKNHLLATLDQQYCAPLIMERVSEFEVVLLFSLCLLSRLCSIFFFFAVLRRNKNLFPLQIFIFNDMNITTSFFSNSSFINMRLWASLAAGLLSDPIPSVFNYARLLCEEHFLLNQTSRRGLCLRRGFKAHFQYLGSNTVQVLTAGSICRKRMCVVHSQDVQMYMN